MALNWSIKRASRSGRTAKQFVHDYVGKKIKIKMNVDVSIGIIFNNTGKVLLSLRNKSILANYWEFPGGKREENEDLEGALKRELFEEINIKILNYFLIYKKNVKIKNTLYKLNFYRIIDYMGELRANENQELLWLEPEKLNSINLLKTNNEIVKIIKKPLIDWNILC